MVSKFGGWFNSYTYPIHYFVNLLYRKYYHLISGQSLRLWTNQIDTFRGAIWRKIAFNDDGIQDLTITLDNFRVFSFLDTISHKTCMPGTGPLDNSNKRRPNAYNIQRAFYSRYGKKHGVKTQVLLLPNGMCGHCWVHSMAQNDKGVINLSGLEEYMKDVLDPFRVGNCLMLPATYADSIYMASEVVIVKGDNTGVYFDRMNGLREKIEHENGLFVNLWRHIQMVHKLKLYNQKSILIRRVIVYWFITNCYTCLNGNTVATRFNLNPPTLSDYLGQEVPPFNFNI